MNPVGRAVHQALRWSVGGFLNWLYTRGAGMYPWVARAVSNGHWPTWVRTVAGQIPLEARVLEVGFGPGYAQEVWAARGQPAWGADLSLAMARRAARRLREQGHSPRLVQARAQALPFPAASVDWVLSTFPTAYILEPATAREFARVLRPGGHLWVLVSVEGGLLRLWARWAQWAARLSGRAASLQDAFHKVYAPLGLQGTVTWEPLPGRARGILFRAVKGEPTTTGA